MKNIKSFKKFTEDLEFNDVDTSELENFEQEESDEHNPNDIEPEDKLENEYEYRRNKYQFKGDRKKVVADEVVESTKKW